MISDNLKRLRIERGLTQQQVGEQLGTSKQAYSYWESGQHTPRFETIKKLANIFGVTTEKITEDYAQPYNESETASFTERLKELRKEKGLNQIEIANYFGTSQPAYQAWESGRRTPAQKSLEKLAKFFNVSVSYLLGETNIRNFSGLTTPKEQSHAPSEPTIGERLKSARKEAGLLQEEVAEHFNITQQAYQVWESGKRNPKKETIQKLADYFNVSYAYLAGVESPLESAEILFKNKVKELELTPEQEEQFKSSIYNFILQKGNQYNNQEISPESFAKRLKRLRKEAHLTQQDVADYFKTSPQSYAQWEKGQRSPSKESLEKLASYFGVSISYLVGESDTIDYGAFEEQSTPTQLSDDKTFIERLKELRKQSGLTQQQLATTQQNIAFWETGRQRPKQPSLIKLANYFNVSIDYLLVGKAQAEEKSSVFPERLKQLRVEAKLTQQQVAEHLDITQSAYAQWETGRINPKKETIQKFADLFNVSYDYLWHGTSEPQTTNAIKETNSGTFPERLKALRKEAGYPNQTSIAKELHISQQTYSQRESGKRNPSKSTLETLANFFNVSTDYLLGKTNRRDVETIELEAEDRLFRAIVESLDLTPEQKEEFKESIYHFILRKRDSYSGDNPKESNTGKDPLITFSKRAQELREEEGSSLEEVATKIGVDMQTYASLEGGSHAPTLDTLEKVSRYFKVTIAYLVGETNVRQFTDDKQAIYKVPQEEARALELDNTANTTFGERLRQVRELEGLTQVEVAEGLGISQPAYQAWETERKNATKETIKRLSDFFGVSYSYLLGISDNVTIDTPVAKPNISFAECLKEARKLSGLSQQAIADKLGISNQAYSRWETGKFEPNLESLKKLAKVLNTSPNYLLGYNQTESIAKAIPQENTFPKRLKELRKLANLTQVEMAEALNVSQPAYVDWEKGRTQPTLDKVPLIAKVLNTSIDYLLQGAPNESRLANFQGKTLGERLVFLRKNAGLTQAEVADRLQVGQNSYSNWENGVRTPIYPIIEKLAEFFGVTPDSLRGKTDNVVVPKITITPNQNQETEIIDLLNNKLTYNQKTLTSKDKKFFTSVIKSYFGD